MRPDIHAVIIQFGGVDDGDNYAHYPTEAKGCVALFSLLASNIWGPNCQPDGGAGKTDS